MGISLDLDKCVKCGGCVEVCPVRVFEQKTPQEFPEVVRESWCSECGQCMMRCPVDAVSIPAIPKDDIVSVGNLPEPDEVDSLLLGRRSVRSFADKEIDRALLERVIVLAASAPSGANVRSTEFTVVQNKEALKLLVQYTAEGLQKMAKALRNPFIRPFLKSAMKKQFGAYVNMVPFFDFVVTSHAAGKDMITFGAPALIAFHGQPTKIAADVNAQLCVQNALVAISGLGLGGLYSGLVTGTAPRDKRMLELFKVPKDNAFYAAIAVGYPKTKLTKYAKKKLTQINWA